MILNAQVTETNISRGSISLDFSFEYEGQEARAYLPLPLSIDTLRALMDLTGVKAWEFIRGQFVRIEIEAEGEEQQLTRIGNIVRDQWIDLKKEKTEPVTE